MSNGASDDLRRDDSESWLSRLVAWTLEVVWAVIEGLLSR
jgi:hypothetical protein